MSQQPRILCVMLAAGRLDMVKRSIKCFLDQTYENRALYILDNGPEPLALDRGLIDGKSIFVDDGKSIFVDRLEPGARRLSIGELRNMANRLSSINVLDTPLIAHWDSDDWYHPARLMTQELFMRQYGTASAGAVGFRSVLFYDATKPTGCGVAGALARGQQDSGEAWIYSSQCPTYCVGGSLMYRREVWEKFPFKDVSEGEDTLWLHNKVRSLGLNGFIGTLPSNTQSEPLMVATIHAGNGYAKIEAGYKEWKRAPEWDAHCRRIMKL